ncbi:MAG: tyrosine-type recombinase/integrase, partial [Solirubrobacteraceae bacterium]
RSGFRESTRDDYRRDLNKYALRYFDAGKQLSAVTPRDVAGFLAWLCKQPAPGGRTLADASVRRVLNPLRACFATARQEDLIRTNPAHGVALPHRPRVDEEEDEVRVLSRDQLAVLLAVVDVRHRTLFQILAATGLRISEALALQWKHIHLDGSHPHVKVRRAYTRGAMAPPKTRHGRRDVPLSYDLVRELRERRRDAEWPRDDDLVFPALTGVPLRYSNLRFRTLKPAAEEAGAPWAGFHTLRHGCASMLFERGANAKQVQRWLGHHSPSFTLATYVHLLSDELDAPLDLGDELGRGDNKVTTHPTGSGRNEADAQAPDLAL